MKYLVYVSSKEKLNTLTLLCVLNELDINNPQTVKDLKIISKITNNYLVKVESIDTSKVNELQANMILKGFSTYPQGEMETLYKTFLNYLFHIVDNNDINRIISELIKCTNEKEIEKTILNNKLTKKFIRL